MASTQDERRFVWEQQKFYDQQKETSGINPKVQSY